VFATKGGYYETYLEDVIKKAKIGKGTFYKYFKNKEDLFICLLNTFLDEWEIYLLATAKHNDQNDSDENIRNFVFKTFEFFRNNEQLCNIYLCNGPGLNPVVVSSIAKFEKRMLSSIILLMKDAVASGAIRDDLDPEFTANFFLGAFLRLAYYHFVLNRKKYTQKELKALSEKFFGLAMQGIKG